MLGGSLRLLRVHSVADFCVFYIAKCQLLVFPTQRIFNFILSHIHDTNIPFKVSSVSVECAQSQAKYAECAGIQFIIVKFSDCMPESSILLVLKEHMSVLVPSPGKKYPHETSQHWMNTHLIPMDPIIVTTLFWFYPQVCSPTWSMNQPHKTHVRAAQFHCTFPFKVTLRWSICNRSYISENVRE